MKKEWNIKIDGRDLDEAEIIDAILESRGIKDSNRFLNPVEDDMVPFEEMQGLDEGCQIVLNAIESDKEFVIHFDCDVDGTSSGTIMTRYLQNYTDKITTIINNGKEHGVERFNLSLLNNNTVLIVVDSLNNDPKVYRKILNTGTELIVLDHHLIEDSLRDANLPFCLISSANNYPNPALSGAGVVFKFCQYIDSVTWNNYSDEYWDLATAGIVADMSDLSEQSPENRYICYQGFNNQKNPAISKINGSFGFDSKAVSFGLAPLVNAANRLNENEKAMRLFLSDDIKEISALVRDLKKCKEKQNEITLEQMSDLIEQGEKQLNQKCMYFFLGDKTEANVTGLLGNKLLEKYQRPLFVLRKYNDVFAGSMRAVGTQNFAKIVNDTGIGTCAGHESAAGIFIPVDLFDEFKQKIEDALKDIEFKQTIDVDVQLNVEQITDSLIRSIKEINKISGSGFAPINVMIGEVDDYEVSNMSGGKHLKIMTPNVTFIKWNFDNWDEMWDLDNKAFYGVGQLDSGFFGRTYYRQVILSDYKFEDIW